MSPAAAVDNAKRPSPSTSPAAPLSPLPAAATTAVDVRADDEPTDVVPPTDIIDMETFSQILDLDDDEDNREFSRGMVVAYFEQAAQTFDDMDHAYNDKDLAKLSSLGHYLKGSSAALGVSKVKDSCEQIQHYGDKRDEEADRNLDDDEALEKIDVALKRVKDEYAAAEKWLKRYFGPPSQGHT